MHSLATFTWQYLTSLCAWTESTLTAIVAPCYAIRSKHISDCCTVRLCLLQSEISRSGDFCTDRQMTTDQTDCFTPCTCAQDNFSLLVVWINRKERVANIHFSFPTEVGSTPYPECLVRCHIRCPSCHAIFPPSKKEAGTGSSEEVSVQSVGPASQEGIHVCVYDMSWLHNDSPIPSWQSVLLWCTCVHT